MSKKRLERTYIKSLSFWISFAKVIHIFGKTKFLMLKNLNANYFDLREWKESNLHLQISHINWNRTNDFTDNLHSIMWFDLQFTLYTVCCLTFQLHSQNYFFIIKTNNGILISLN